MYSPQRNHTTQTAMYGGISSVSPEPRQTQQFSDMTRSTTPPRNIVSPSNRNHRPNNTGWHQDPDPAFLDIGGSFRAMSLNDAPPPMELEPLHHHHRSHQHQHHHDRGQDGHQYHGHHCHYHMQQQQLSPPPAPLPYQRFDYHSQYPLSPHHLHHSFSPPHYGTTMNHHHHPQSPLHHQHQHSPYPQYHLQPVTPPRPSHHQPQYTYSPVVEFDEEDHQESLAEIPSNGRMFQSRRKLDFVNVDDSIMSTQTHRAHIHSISPPISPPRNTFGSPKISQFACGSPPRKMHGRHGSIGDHLNDVLSPTPSSSPSKSWSSIIDASAIINNANKAHNQTFSPPRASTTSLFSFSDLIPGSEALAKSPPRSTRSMSNSNDSSDLFDKGVLHSPGRLSHESQRPYVNEHHTYSMHGTAYNTALPQTGTKSNLDNNVTSSIRNVSSEGVWQSQFIHTAAYGPPHMHRDQSQQQYQKTSPRHQQPASWFDGFCQDQSLQSCNTAIPPASDPRPAPLTRSNSANLKTNSKQFHQRTTTKHGSNFKHRHGQRQNHGTHNANHRRQHGQQSQKSMQFQPHSQQQQFLEKGESVECKSLRKQMKAREKEGYESVKRFALSQLATIQPHLHWRIFMDLADLAKRENDIDEARRCFEEVHRHEPNAPQGWLEHAKLEEENAELDTCEKLLELGLSHPACRYNESLIIKYVRHQEQKNKLHAARIVLARMKHAPVDKGWKTILEGALMESRAGNIELARRILKYLMSHVPKHGPIFFEAYKLEEKCENYERALIIIENGLKENPRYGPLWFAAFHIYEKLAHRKIQQMDTENTDNTSKQSLPIVDLSKVRNSIKKSLDSSNISKELHWKVHFEHAQIEERAGNIEEARDALVKSIQDAMPNLRWKVWLAGARLELNAGRVQVAREVLRRAVDEVPVKSKAVVMIERARLEEYVGAIDKARRFLKEAKEEARHEWKVFLEAILLEMRSGDHDRAIREAEEALRIHPGTGRLWAVLIQLKYTEGEESQYKTFKQAYEKVPKSGEVWCEGARIRLNPLSRRFNLAKAQQCLKFAMKFTPQYGDSLIEFLRLDLLMNGPRIKADEDKYLEQLCVNADPNYGPLWVHCKKDPLDSTRQVLKRALDMLMLELNQHRHIYQHAILRSERPPIALRSAESQEQEELQQKRQQHQDYMHYKSNSTSSIDSNHLSTMSASSNDSHSDCGNDSLVHEVDEDDIDSGANSDEESDNQLDSSFGDDYYHSEDTDEDSNDLPDENLRNKSGNMFPDSGIESLSHETGLDRSHFIFGLQSYTAALTHARNDDKSLALRFRYVFSDVIM